MRNFNTEHVSIPAPEKTNVNKLLLDVKTKSVYIYQ